MVIVTEAACFNSAMGESAASFTRLMIRDGPFDEVSLQLVRPGLSTRICLELLPFECDAIVIVEEKELM
jgi:hypothetical protein